MIKLEDLIQSAWEWTDEKMDSVPAGFKDEFEALADDLTAHLLTQICGPENYLAALDRLAEIADDVENEESVEESLPEIMKKLAKMIEEGDKDVKVIQVEYDA